MIYGKYGPHIKLKAHEGDVKMVRGSGAQGTTILPSYSEEIEKNQFVTLVGDKEVSSKVKKDDIILGKTVAEAEPEGTQPSEDATYGNYIQRGITVAIMCSKVDEIYLAPNNKEIKINDSIAMNNDGEWDKSDTRNSTLVLESAPLNSGNKIVVAFGFYRI
jgi:hypothetical protein